MTEALVGLYVHIPFCVRKCGYCDFNAGPAAESVRERYVVDLCGEIAQSPHAGKMGRTVFFGGGTPSELSTGQLRRIVSTLQRGFRLLPEAEWTIECNPGTVSLGSLRAMRAMGFNRISLGVQSLWDHHLQALGRIHDSAAAVEAYGLATLAGFENRNLDFIFGLPGQTLDEWRRDVDAALALGPEHLSLYQLTIEKGTDFGIRYARGELTVPGEDLAADMYEHALDAMSSAGYEQYEISNFARPGRRCEHNAIYWRNEPYVGFGVSAASYLDGCRWTNTAGMGRYHDRVTGGMAPVEAEERLPPREAAAEAMILGLRTSDGICVGEIGGRYGIDAEEAFGPVIRRFEGLGLLSSTRQRVRLTRRGVLLANVVCAEFLS